MTRPRLILAIRCLTLLGVGALLLGTGWLYAGLASVLVGLMMPVLGAVTVSVCDAGCSTYPAGSGIAVQATIVISGVADGTCPFCSVFNGTFVTDVNSICGTTTTCGSHYNLGAVSCGSNDVKVGFYFTKTGGNTILNVLAVTDCGTCDMCTVVSGHPVWIGLWAFNLGTSPVDCAAVSYPQVDSAGVNSFGTACDATPASMSITVHP